MWVEFVVVSCPCSEGFSPGSLVFLPPLKPKLRNSESNLNARTPLNRVSVESSLRYSVGKQITAVYVFTLLLFLTLYFKTKTVTLWLCSQI